MTMPAVIGLLLNTSLLLALTLVFDLVAGLRRLEHSWSGRLMMGAATGLIGVGLMLAPVYAEPGIQFDTRSVLLSISGLFLGPWPTLMAVVMTAVARYWIGGAWIVGVLVIVASGALGVAWQRVHRRLHGRRLQSFYLLGLVVHVVMLSLIATIPGSGPALVREIAVPVMALYPLATVVLGLLLTQRLQRQRTVLKLHESEARYRLLAEQAQDLVYRYEFEPVPRFTYVSPSATALTGYTPEEHYADPQLGRAIVHPEDLPLLDALIDGRTTHGAPLLLRWRRRDGQVIWTEQRTRLVRSRDGRLVAVEGVARDVTAREEAAALLSRREREYRELFDANPHPMWVYDVASVRFLAVNQRAIEVYGWSRDEFLSMTIFDIRAPEDRAALTRLLTSGIRNDQVTLTRHQTRDGRLLDVEVIAHQTEFDGRPARLVLAHDVTESRRIQAERERLIAAIEQSDDSIVITNQRGVIEYVNPAFERVTGYTREEAVGRNPRILKSGEQDDADYQRLWHTILSGQTWRGRLVNRRKDGTLFAEDATISPVRGADGAISSFVAVKRDVTQELERQTQYLQAQKMESVGRLAAGVAHDFNNLLTIINGSAELAAGSVPPDGPVAEDLRQILAAGARGAALTRQMLAFSRQQIVAPTVLDVDGVIDPFRRMLERLLPEHITLEVSTRLAPARVRCDPGQLEQILLNLVVNARDAMPSGGRLRIETDLVMLSAADARQLRPPLAAGPYARIRVADSGIGMDTSVLAQIFEPFFTTKAIGKGTGIGLSTVLRIVTDSGGGLRVASQPGHGSTFEVFLPAVAAVDEEPVAASHGDVQLPDAVVLLVEDEAMLRTLARRALTQAGCRVLVASNGREGLEMAVAQLGRLDLVITDIIMPELGGREMVRALEARRPGLPVLYTSGYTGDQDLADWLTRSGAPFLAKPYAPADLVRAAAAVIERVRGAARPGTPSPP